eukprot:GHUV01025047.1.p1 GENE.GHUV01025047.1~~GHUV01025047.1.p1  ORF type:complete len:131 (+),score=15.64 GHUV01025047.1:587-979(+)
MQDRAVMKSVDSTIFSPLITTAVHASCAQACDYATLRVSGASMVWWHSTMLAALMCLLFPIAAGSIVHAYMQHRRCMPVLPLQYLQLQQWCCHCSAPHHHMAADSLAPIVCVYAHLYTFAYICSVSDMPG